jgi:hypothetical protein
LHWELWLYHTNFGGNTIQYTADTCSSSFVLWSFQCCFKLMFS